MSTTATVLLSALATSSVSPSGESASAFGVVPGGAFGNSATRDLLARRQRRRRRPPRPRWCWRRRRTAARRPATAPSRSDARRPRPRRCRVERRRDRTPAPSRRPTARRTACAPSRDSSAVYGSAGRSTRAPHLAASSRSIALIARPSTCTAYSRVPSRLIGESADEAGAAEVLAAGRRLDAPGGRARLRRRPSARRFVVGELVDGVLRGAGRIQPRARRDATPGRARHGRAARAACT